VRNLGRELVARGHSVAVATIAGDTPGADAGISEEDGVRVHRLRSSTQRLPQLLPSGRPYHPPFPDPDVTLALRRIVAEERPSIVHAHNWMVHSYLPLKHSSGAALAMTLHDYGIACAKRSLLYRGAQCSGPGFSKCLHCAGRHYGTGKGMAITLGNWATQPLLRHMVDVFIPVSRAVAVGNELAESDVPFEVVPNFAPDDVADRADDAHPALAALPATPFWLYVGALSAHKGVPVLVDAYRRLSATGTDGVPPLVVMGRQMGESPIDLPRGITVIEDAPHAAVMAAWRRASLGFIPSVFPDPCPTVAIEAMASGVAVIASRIGGLPDLVDDGRTGILVEPGDPAALAGAMRRALQAPDEFGAMAVAARARAPRFMATEVVQRIMRIYDGLAA
jgi:glycosyltransferase involved in cell wall biosynthesis